MLTFVMFTRIAPGAAPTARALHHLEQHVMEHIARDCPSVRWQKSWAVLGREDYLDIFEAPDIDAAMKVAMIVRSYGFAHTEVAAIVPWERMKGILGEVTAAETRSGRI
jgi:uncharacterized protein with GYD domain